MMSKEVKDVINIAKKAGEKILEIYDTDYKKYEKRDKSPVTEADLISEKIILQGLKKYNYGFLSEEKGDNLRNLNNGKNWVIDPLDGTLDFIQKTGEFSIMVGLVCRGEPILGVVYQPTEDKVYFAEKGRGAYLAYKGAIRKLRVSQISKMEEVRLLSSRNHFNPMEVCLAKKLNFKEIKKMGSIGVKVCLIAQGEADLYLNISDRTYTWDTCAPGMILSESAGKITDLDGKRINYNRKEIRNSRGLVASNGLIHNQIVDYFTDKVRVLNNSQYGQDK